MTIIADAHFDAYTIQPQPSKAAHHNGSAPLNGAPRPHANGVANGHVNGHARKASTPKAGPSTLLETFIKDLKELDAYRNGKPITVDGETLSIPAVTAAARYGASVQLDDSPTVRARIASSRAVMTGKVDGGFSVYGVSTGYGGSAVTRTDDPIALGSALLQHQHAGVLPNSTSEKLPALPLLDPLASTSMPEAWVRGAILVRMNSLIRGHSGVRWELIVKMGELLKENITPLVPLRGSISASGDLQPLSYIAGTLTGNPSIRVFDGPQEFGARRVVPSAKALADHGIAPLPLQSKEHLGILNGTAFSASVASLALNDAVHLALLAQVLTAMGAEALAGTRGSFDPFIHDEARPHAGQVEAAATIYDLLSGSKFAQQHEEEVTIDQDDGHLRQDRYPLRTAPQFLGPQLEDLLSARAALSQECNATTDNPLVDGASGRVHNGGNFQAMAVTNAMEKARLALHHVGKLLFAQCTELVNPEMNRGLPPSLAATDPSLDFHAKGVDIATAAYVAELGYLANPVSTHIQSAEMHNQAVNSLALISARATINSLEVLSILTSSYLYVLCQALDLRALQSEFDAGMVEILASELSTHFGASAAPVTVPLLAALREALDATSTMDAAPRMAKVAAACTTPLVDFLTGSTAGSTAAASLPAIPAFRTALASRLTALLTSLRASYLSRPAPAAKFLSKTRPVYLYVRETLGVRMHGGVNLTRFEDGPGEGTVGQSISAIHESIRDGAMAGVVARLFD